MCQDITLATRPVAIFNALFTLAWVTHTVTGMFNVMSIPTILGLTFQYLLTSSPHMPFLGRKAAFGL